MLSRAVHRRQRRLVAFMLPIVASASRRGAVLPTVHFIDNPPCCKETTMTTRLAPRLFALASAAFFTVVMLTSINGMATSEPAPGQMARAAAAHQA
jgi:hypothetical protein